MLDFDILCLQEVSSHFLKDIQRLKLSFVYCLDYERDVGNKLVPFYLVILTKHKISNIKKLHISESKMCPIRTKIFIEFMKVFGWSMIKRRGALLIDLKIGKNKYRVFSIHLSLNSPRDRMKDLISILMNSANSRNIVCGDFNVIEQMYIKPFSWLMGSSVKEANPFYPERRMLEMLFKNWRFINPLINRKTHVIFNAQLDHILVSNNLEILESGVVPCSFGSDHYPVYVDIGT